MTTGGPFDAIGFQAFQPVEQRGDFKEWNYTETHLPVRRIDEHNACVTALRAALAREAEAKQERHAFALELRNVQETLFTKLDELKAALADAARLREALRELAIMAKGLKDFRCGCCDSTWQLGQPESHAPGCLAKLDDAHE